MNDTIARGLALAALKKSKLNAEDIEALKSIGHFLSGWNCGTGMPVSEPQTIPYTYATGDYYIVSALAESGSDNYKPSGASYTGAASTVVETDDVKENSFYFYDGTSWMLLGSSGGTLDHNLLANRDAENQHPISAIEGLEEALAEKADADDIPTMLSELTDDSTHRTVTDTEKNTWNDKQNALTQGSGIVINENGVITYDPEEISSVEYVDANVDQIMFYLGDRMVSFDPVTGKTELQKSNARSNIGLAPDTKTSNMTQPVGLGSDGKLYTEPGDTAGVVAPAYDSESTYEKGDLVIENRILYKALVGIDTPEEFDPTHWEQTTVDDVLRDYIKYSSLVVTCVTQDGVTVTGQTVTLRKGADASGTVYATAAYNGQPVTFLVPAGFDYYVSVSDTLDHHFGPTTAHGVINAGTINVTLVYSDLSNIRTVRDVQAALNVDTDLSGLVGEQVTATRNNTTLSFDVCDYDSTEGSVWLLLHDTLPTQMVFEPSQALMWCENGLSAGSYCFTHSNAIYYFTLTKDIPEGGQLRATTTTFETYKSQDTTAKLENGTVSATEISGATSLGTTATGLLNHMDRVQYGSNNAGESGLFAWLNSNAEPNTNLQRINKLSRTYSSGADGGFLRGFDPDDLACFDNVTWTVKANDVYEAPAELGGIAVKSQEYNITGIFGLAMFANIGLSGNTPWDLYVGAENADRIKYYNGSARYWWVLDPIPYYAVSEYIVLTSGGSVYNYAYNSYGVAPACKITKKS